MEPDQFQQAWRAETSQTRVMVDSELLRKEVQRSLAQFQSSILWRDLREGGIAAALLPLWIYLGVTFSPPWTWYLSVPALLWVAGFILTDRLRHPKKQSDGSEPLLESVNESLVQVEHQIWLLENVFWWYLLPLGMPVLAFFLHVTLLSSTNWIDALGGGGFLSLFALALYSWIYWLNQRAVRVQLEPRRQELLAMLCSLGEDSAGELATIERAKNIESSRKLRGWIVEFLSCVLTLVAIYLADGFFKSRYDQPPRSSGPSGEKFAELIADLREEKNLVGLAAMVTIDGKIEAAAASGPRMNGKGVALEIGDQWHLGGITKSITATMIARLVESGKMDWSDTVGEFFPEGTVHADWKAVTLKQLLTDTAGAPAQFPRKLWFQRPSPGAERMAARREEVLNVLGTPPAFPPGQKNVYSNVGITIAGAMAEQATGTPWEDLVQREVFDPLKLTGAGFGPPRSSNAKLEQPRGHATRLAGKIAMPDKADNSPIMGPSGSVRMTLEDLCLFANDQLRGELGHGQLLSAESYRLLHTPALNHYACGWIVDEPGRSVPFTTYWHNGSNTMWYALVAFIPETKMVVAVTSNDGDSVEAEGAAWKILRESVQEFQGQSRGN